jgi:hypothetical protein
MADKPHRIQIRVSEALYTKLLKEAILCDVPFAQVCRIHLSGKKLIDERGEDYGQS